MDNKKHFSNSLKFVLYVISERTKYKGKLPEPEDVLKEVRNMFATPKRTTKSKTMKQRGGNFILEFIKNQVRAVIGISSSEEWGECAKIETSLNLLCWASFVYLVTVPTISSWGIRLDTNMTAHSVATALSSPADYILSHIPGLEDVSRETAQGRIMDYCMRIWTDYKELGLSETVTGRDMTYLAGSIVRLWKVQSHVYEEMYIVPLICLIAKFYKPCEKRCRKQKTKS
jgi:hypothetical protein